MSTSQPEVPGTAAGIGAAINDALSPDHVTDNREIPRVSGRFILVFTLMTFGGNLAILTPTLFSVAYKVQLIAPAQKESVLGLVLGLGAVITIITSPLFGLLTDRTYLRWGKRRPWIVVGIGLLAIGGVGLAFSESVLPLVISYMVYIAGTAAIINSVSPVIADQVPESQRGKIGGLSGAGAQLAGVVGTLAGSALVGNVFLLFLIPVAAVAILFVIYIRFVSDAPAVRSARQSVGQAVQKMVFNPRKYPNVGWVWLGRFLLFGGINFYSTYNLYFLLDRLGLTPAQAGQRLALIGGLGILVASGFAVIGGILSDRFHRRKAFVYLGIVFVAGGLLLLAFAHDFWAYAIGSLVLVAGAGVFGSVDQALASEVVPDRSGAGRWMSIIGTSGYVPTAFAPLIAPLILATGGGSNYLALFIVGAAVTAGAAITTWRVRGVR